MGRQTGVYQKIELRGRVVLHCCFAAATHFSLYTHKFVDGTFSFLLRRNSDFSRWTQHSWSSESEKKCNLWQPQHCLLQKLKSTFCEIFLEVTGIMQPLIHNLFHYFSGFVPLCESRHPPPHVKPPLAIRRSWSFALYTIEFGEVVLPLPPDLDRLPIRDERDPKISCTMLCNAKWAIFPSVQAKD